MPGYRGKKKKNKKKKAALLLKNVACSHFLQMARCTSLPFMRPINISSGISTIPQPRSIAVLEEGNSNNDNPKNTKNIDTIFCICILCYPCNWKHPITGHMARATTSVSVPSCMLLSYEESLSPLVSPLNQWHTPTPTHTQVLPSSPPPQLHPSWQGGVVAGGTPVVSPPHWPPPGDPGQGSHRWAGENAGRSCEDRWWLHRRRREGCWGTQGLTEPLSGSLQGWRRTQEYVCLHPKWLTIEWGKVKGDCWIMSEQSEMTAVN